MQSWIRGKVSTERKAVTMRNNVSTQGQYYYISNATQSFSFFEFCIFMAQAEARDVSSMHKLLRETA